MQSYIIQVVLFQLLFLVVYEALLKKETFFKYNRVYLLLAPVLAFLIPFLKIELLGRFLPLETYGILLPEVIIGNAITKPNTGSIDANSILFPINWWIALYFSGMIVSLYIFVKKFMHLNRLFRFQKVRVENYYRIIEIPNSTIACTFFNTIFLGESLSKKEKQSITSHELIHVKQKHSLDLLYFEFLRIVFWFNPLIYVYQSHISGVHEFLADKEVVKHTEKKQYYQQLLNSAFNTQNISFINQFYNHSLIKKRIVMLQKSQSKAIAKFKYLIVAPLILVMLTYVSCAEENSDKTDIQLEQTQIPDKDLKNKETNQEEIPFALIDQVPLFPGCEGLASNEEQKKCMSQKIQEHVQKNFDTKIGSELDLTGTNRVIVQFKINKEGKIADVKARAAHPILKEEGIRVINSLPQMVPGKQNGQEVGVMYSLPIVFQVD